MIVKYDVIIVGAGIVGLSLARASAIKGLKVAVFEKNEFAVGASIRNFGLIWPIGQPKGKLLNRAIRSTEIWAEIAKESNLPIYNNGSLHLATNEIEKRAFEEFYEKNKNNGYDIELISSQKAVELSPYVNESKVNSALWSKTEMTTTSPIAIKGVADYLSLKYSIQFYFNSPISEASEGKVVTNGKTYYAHKVFICSGQEIETLYSDVIRNQPVTKSKLQMMSALDKSSTNQLGASLCAGLTLLHYSSFSDLKILDEVRSFYHNYDKRYLENGIHILVSQHSNGEFIIGDSHEYGDTIYPFDSEEVNHLILKYLYTWSHFKDLNIIRRWNGTYLKMTNGSTELILDIDYKTTIVNGLGGAGMTLSFGLAEEIIEDTF